MAEEIKRKLRNVQVWLTDHEARLDAHAGVIEDHTTRIITLEETVAGLLIPRRLPMSSSTYEYKIYAEPIVGTPLTVRVKAETDKEAVKKAEKMFNTQLVKTEILSKHGTEKSSSPQLLVPTIMEKTARFMEEKYKRVPEAIHAHDLTRCSQKRVMEEQYPELAEKTLFEPSVQIGEALHTFVEALPTIDTAQKVFERTVNRHLVVGKPDITTEEAVYNLKFRRRLYDRPLEHDVLRASIYAWLARKPYGHIVYLNPREFREWVVSPVTTETVLYLIEHPKSPRWDWECRLCPFKGYCPLMLPLRRSRSGQEVEYEWH